MFVPHVTYKKSISVITLPEPFNQWCRLNSYSVSVKSKYVGHRTIPSRANFVVNRGILYIRFQWSACWCKKTLLCICWTYLNRTYVDQERRFLSQCTVLLGSNDRYVNKQWFVLKKCTLQFLFTVGCIYP